MLINYPLGTSVLIVSSDKLGQLVAVHRKESPQLICFPGGKQELDEDVVLAAAREAYEETGIIVDPKKLIPIYAGICEGQKEYWVTAFIYEVEGTIALNSPEPEMRPKWVTKEEFMANTSFPIFNSNVFAAIKNYF